MTLSFVNAIVPSSLSVAVTFSNGSNTSPTFNVTSFAEIVGAVFAGASNSSLTVSFFCSPFSKVPQSYSYTTTGIFRFSIVTIPVFLSKVPFEVIVTLDKSIFFSVCSRKSNVFPLIEIFFFWVLIGYIKVKFGLFPIFNHINCSFLWLIRNFFNLVFLLTSNPVILVLLHCKFSNLRFWVTSSSEILVPWQSNALNSGHFRTSMLPISVVSITKVSNLGLCVTSRLERFVWSHHNASKLGFLLTSKFFNLVLEATRDCKLGNNSIPFTLSTLG